MSGKGESERGRRRPRGAPDSLESELGRLCRGRGVAAPDLALRIGPQLGRLLVETGLSSAAGAGEGAAAPDPSGPDRSVRATLVAWLEERVARLPADLRLVAAVAFGLDPTASGRFLRDRIAWLSAHLDRDDRTVRRRLEEALRLLAEDGSSQPRTVGVAGVVRAEPAAPGTLEEGWYLGRLRSLVRMDQRTPEIVEERTIVAARSGLDRVAISITLPHAGRGVAVDRDLLGDVAYGGILEARERPSESQFRFVVTLARQLASGESQRLALRLRLPNGMASHYGVVPLTRCDEFHLRMRFAAKHPPTGVWLLDGVPPRRADDDPAGLEPVFLDRAGECDLVFRRLRLGRSYGVCWRGGENGPES